MNLTVTALDFIPESRRAVWNYYGFVGLDKDGYPLSRSKLIDGMTVAHPIHGAYLINEYIKQYERSRSDTTSLTRALALAAASVHRMAFIDNSLRFMYKINDGITPHNFNFFSALTQARYLAIFSRLYQITKASDLAIWAKMLFQSLLLPVGEGGVFLEKENVTVFEEYPTQVPSFVLNGWLTVLNNLFEYGYTMSNSTALTAARQSSKSLIKMLPLYDAPEFWCTRYKLSGPVLNRIIFAGAVPKILSVRIMTAGGIFDAQPHLNSAYDTLHVLKLPSPQDNSFVFKACLSVFDYPRKSVLDVEIESDEPAEATWSVGIPQLNPLFTTPKAVGQRRINVLQAQPGLTRLSTEIPMDLLAGWVATPVPFSKKIEGKYHNVYHYLHVKALTQLNVFMPSGTILYWRDRWLDYTERWSDFPIYNHPDIAHSVVDRGSYATQREYLTTPQLKLIGGIIERQGA